MRMVLFAGTVLPPTGTGLIAADAKASFHVSDAEKKQLACDLVGKPVRFEHKPELHVGRVQSAQVRPDGSIAVVGRVDPRGTSLTADYVRSCMREYRGLSLCHRWTGVDRRRGGHKEPIEVSLCTAPRRPGCYVELHTEDYNRAAPHTPMSEVVQDVVQASVKQEDDTPSENPDEAEQAMLKALEMRDLYEKTKKQLAAAELKITEQETKERLEKEAEDKEISLKSDKLRTALQESWNTAMGPNVTFESASTMFDQISKQDAKLGHELLQLIEVASKNAVQAQQELQATKQQQERSKLQDEYNRMLDTQGSATRANAASPVAAVAAAAPVVAANPYIAAAQMGSVADNPYAKQALSIRDAFKSLDGSGGAVGQMQRLVEAASNKKRKY